MPGDGKMREKVSISLDAELIAEAKAVGINIQSACEAGIRKRVAEAPQWKAEHKEAIQGWNEWVNENGLPLPKYRQF